MNYRRHGSMYELKKGTLLRWQVCILFWKIKRMFGKPQSAHDIWKTSTDRVNGHHLTKPNEETILFDVANNEVLFDECARQQLENDASLADTERKLTKKKKCFLFYFIFLPTTEQNKIYISALEVNDFSLVRLKPNAMSITRKLKWQL